MYGGLLEQMLSTQRERESIWVLFLGVYQVCFFFRIQKKGKEKKINRGRSNFFGGWGMGKIFFVLVFF